MDSGLVFVLVFTILLIPITSFAQTTDNIKLDFTHYGKFSIQNLQVSEKEFYKEISMNVQIKVQDLELEDIVFMAPFDIRLVNENGKIYTPQVAECRTPVTVTITGSKGGIGGFPVCFWVEKEFNNFKIQYHNQALLESYQVGEINLNEHTNQKIEKLPSDASSETKNPPMTKSNNKDFFSQIIDMIKRLFNFF